MLPPAMDDPLLLMWQALLCGQAEAVCVGGAGGREVPLWQVVACPSMVSDVTCINKKK